MCGHSFRIAAGFFYRDFFQDFSGFSNVWHLLFRARCFFWGDSFRIFEPVQRSGWITRGFFNDPSRIVSQFNSFLRFFSSWNAFGILEDSSVGSSRALFQDFQGFFQGNPKTILVECCGEGTGSVQPADAIVGNGLKFDWCQVDVTSFRILADPSGW